MKNLYPALLIFAFLVITHQSFSQATLPVSRTIWNAGEPVGWTDGGCGQRLTSSACSGDNATIFDDDGNYRIVHFNATPTQLIMKLKAQGIVGFQNYLVVEESDDGVTYTEIPFGRFGTDVSAIPITDCADITLNLSSTTRYVKWTYIKIEAGNIDMDDVRIYGTPKYYRSVASGDWMAGSPWEVSEDNLSFAPATGGPSSGDNSIIIRNGHTISISTANVSMKNTSVESGGVLRIATNSSYTIDGSGHQLNIFDGGKLLIDVGASNTPAAILGSGTVHVWENGNVQSLTGSGTATGVNYLRADSKFTYDNNAVFEWSNPGTVLGAQTEYFKTSTLFVPILRISTTPAFPFGGAGNTLFNAKLECNASISFQGTGDKTFKGGIGGTGTVTQTTSGKIILPTASSTLSGSVTLNVLSSGLVFTVGTTVVAGANVTINGPEDGTITKTGSLIVDGTLNLTGMNVLNTGMGGVIVNGTLKTSNQSGFYGTSATVINGFVQLSPGSTIEYNRNDGLAQTVSSTVGSPSTPYANIKLSGSGSKNTAGSFSPAGNVIITENAIFNCTNNIGDANTGLIMDGGRLIVNTTGLQPSMALLPYNITGGVVEFKGGTTMTAQTVRSESYNQIEITGINVGNSSGNITLKSNGIFTVKTGGFFTINADAIVGPSGNQSVIIENGGTFRTGDIHGFNGGTGATATSVSGDIEIISLLPGSAVIYARATIAQEVTTGVTYQNIRFTGGVKNAPAGVLNVNGNFYNETSFNHNQGTVQFGGTALQAIEGTSPVTFYHVIDNNTTNLAINNAISVVGSLKFGSAARLHLNQPITLVSGPAHTANVGVIPNNAQITYNGSGNFIVERYIPNHSKAWQFLSVATRPGQTIKAAWQEGATGLGNNPVPGYGTVITGHVAGNGFDVHTPIGPSMKTFDPVTEGWLGVPNTDVQNISNVQGYMLMVRGDRSVTSASAPATATILRTTGRIYDPATTPPVITVAAGSFQSVGNPYASAIDFALITKSAGVDNTFYVWDPKLTTGPNSAWGLGGYQTFIWDNFSNTYIVTPGGGSYISGNTNIESGQAFLVHSAGAGGTITFTENCKVDGSNVVTRPGFAGRNMSQLKADLHVRSGSESVLVDGTRILFGEYTKGVDGADAIKLNNTGENISIFNPEKNLIVEARPFVEVTDTLHYRIDQLKNAAYELRFHPANMDVDMVAYLVDNFTGTKVPLSLTNENIYSFTVTDDVVSKANDRFYVVFRKVKPMAIKIEKVTRDEQHVTINWEAEPEYNVNAYTLLRSFDGLNFQPVQEMLPSGNIGDGMRYTSSDTDVPLTGVYYKLTASTNAGIIESNVVKVDAVDLTPMISVYPNPVENKTIRLQLNNIPAGRYPVQLYNSFGQLVYNGNVSISGRVNAISIALPSTIFSGIYNLMINRTVQRIMLK